MTPRGRSTWLNGSNLAPLLLLLSGCTATLGDSDQDEPRELDGLAITDVDRDEPFVGPIESAPSDSLRFARLNHAQYDNTVRDLLRLPGSPNLAGLFVAEPLITTFDTDASSFQVSPDLRRDYERAAESIAHELVADDAWLSRAIGSDVLAAKDSDQFIREFGKRAFRRPLTEEEVVKMGLLFQRAPDFFEAQDEFKAGVELLTSYMLQSPHFLYRSELSSEKFEGLIPLSAFEIASKISYALTASMPDEELFAAAESGQLGTAAEVKKQVARLLESPAAQQTVTDFHVQLLKMRDFDAISKDTSRFPEFSDGFASDLSEEVNQFIRHVVFEKNLGLQELLTASYTFANDRIARLYGQPPSGSGDEFSFLELPSNERSGLLTQVGFMAMYGEGGSPNTILRGVNIAERVLCIHLPPPPDDVPTLDSVTGETNRERVENLTSDPGCAGCHQVHINPLGFAFESFDGVGAFRTTDNNLPVDTSSSYILDDEPISFSSSVDLLKQVSTSHQAHDCYAKHWAEFLYGRELREKSPADQALALQAGWLSRSDGSVKELLTELIVTDAFLTRSP